MPGAQSLKRNHATCSRAPGGKWEHVGKHGGGTFWDCGPLRVLSELAQAEYPDGSGDVGPQWLISVSYKRRRPNDKQLRKALRAFNMVDAEEDNHMPGGTRQFWLPVDPGRRVGCECKVTEVQVVEVDGHTWSNPLDGDPEGCRGCLYESMRRIYGFESPCPIHVTGKSDVKRTAPWDYTEAPVSGEPVMINEPSPEGAVLGEQLARLADQAEVEDLKRFPDQLPRCDDCAFRKGTRPNRSMDTLMDAVKCIVEGRPFYCHKGIPEDGKPKRLCSGWGSAQAAREEIADVVDAAVLSRMDEDSTETPR